MPRWILPLFLLPTLAAPAIAQDDTATEAERDRATWNSVFERSKARGWKWEANEFLSEVVADLHPGSALDIGMGQGRNSLFLAEGGWQVTGIDISDEAIAQSLAQAKEAGLELTALRADVNTFDYGEEKWDLVVGMYMHSLITGNADKIMRSLKPGGLLVLEGFHRDLNRESVEGGYFGFATHELLDAFARLRVLHYEDLTDNSDWGRGGRNPIVRFVARKPYPTTGAGGPALGADAPGMEPSRVLDGIVNTEAIELNGVIADGGREFWFPRRTEGVFRMFRMRIENGRWSHPHEVSLLPAGVDPLGVDMTLSADGQDLVFVGPGPSLDLWHARRGRFGWSTARRLSAPISTESQEIYPCFVRDGSLYFSSNRAGGQGGSDLWRAQRQEDGSFAEAVNLGPTINTEHQEGDAWINPDETLMVFASDRPGGLGGYDLWISFRGDDGDWSAPRNLGPSFNSEAADYCPMGTWNESLFSFSRRDGRSWAEVTQGEIFWVDAAALEAFRN